MTLIISPGNCNSEEGQVYEEHTKTLILKKKAKQPYPQSGLSRTI